MLTVDFVIVSAELQKEFDHALRNVIVESLSKGDFKTARVINSLAQSLLRVATPETTYMASIAAYMERTLTDEQKELAKEEMPFSPSVSAYASANTIVERLVHFELENDCQRTDQTKVRAENVGRFVFNCQQANKELANIIFDANMLNNLSELVEGRVLTLENRLKEEQEKEAQRLVEKALTK